jgi:hypothetical protein
VNNTALHVRITHPKGHVARLLESKRSDAEIVEELYLAAFARLPSEKELQAVRASLAEAPSRKEGWEDLLWALLNCPEFAFNH